MKKVWVLLLVLSFIFYSSAEKLNKKKRNSRSMDEADGDIDSNDIIESVHSTLPDEPQIKIRFAGRDEDDGDATISLDSESAEDDENDDDDDDDLPIRKRELPKSKTEDSHSFL